MVKSILKQKMSHQHRLHCHCKYIPYSRFNCHIIRAEPIATNIIVFQRWQGSQYHIIRTAIESSARKVTAFDQLDMTLAEHYKSTRSTQPSIPPGQVNRVWRVLLGKAGCVHSCRVAGNTVWSHMASDTP